MFLMTIYLIISLGGLSVAFVGAIYGGPIGMMAVMFGGVLEVIPLLQMTTTIRLKRLVPFFMKLKDYEHISLFINNRNQVGPLIFNNKHEGILQKLKFGIVDDKGTPLTWGLMPISISMQKCGVTIDLKRAQYLSELKENHGIRYYEQAIREYLGPAKYGEFEKKYRKNNPKQDIYSIKRELRYLMNQYEPADPLSEKVLGETIDFKDFLGFLQYAYDPKSTENAMNAEKIQAKREAMAYKETKDAAQWGKFIVMILIGLAIFFVIMQAIGGFGAIFGGG